MDSEYLVPWTTRLKMSRPTSSVPNRWCQLGGAKWLLTLSAVMLWLLNRPGAMAMTRNSATISPPAMADAFGRGHPLRTSTGSSVSIATVLMLSFYAPFTRGSSNGYSRSIRKLSTTKITDTTKVMPMIGL